MPDQSLPPLAQSSLQGIIFSRALMDMLSFRVLESCTNGTYGATGSDNLISICLWKLGHAFLDPGTWVEHEHSFTFVHFVSVG